MSFDFDERNRRWYREAGQALTSGDPIQAQLQAQRVRVLLDEERRQRLAAEGKPCSGPTPMPGAYWNEEKGMWMLREQPPAPAIKWHCTDAGMCHTGCECCQPRKYTDQLGQERQCNHAGADFAYGCVILDETRWFPSTRYVCRVALLRRALLGGDHR